MQSNGTAIALGEGAHKTRALRKNLAPRNNRALRHRVKRFIPMYIMLIGAFVYYLLFHYLPIYGIQIAFRDYRLIDGITGSPWAGFKYFRQALFETPMFWGAFKNTIIISSLKFLVNFPAPIILALMINEIKNMAFKKVTQTISYLPHFISWVVLAGLFRNILSPSSGFINMVIRAFGGEPIFFVGSNDWFRAVLVFTSTFKGIGWGTIIYLAALANVNTELYEAAAIDGAGRLRQTWMVTIPAISNIIVLQFILSIRSIIGDDFQQIFNMYSPVVYQTGDVIATYNYRLGLESMRYSFSSAVGLFMNVIGLALVVATNWVVKNFSEYGLW